MTDSYGQRGFFVENIEVDWCVKFQVKSDQLCEGCGLSNVIAPPCGRLGKTFVGGNYFYNIPNVYVSSLKYFQKSLKICKCLIGDAHFHQSIQHLRV